MFQILLVSQSLSCSTALLTLLQDPSICLYFSLSFIFTLRSAESQNLPLLLLLLLLLLLFTPLEFFTSVLADGFSMEFE